MRRACRPIETIQPLIERMESRTMLAADLPALHFSAGGLQVVDSIGRSFVPDAGFSGGQQVQSPISDIVNVTEDRLFSSYRTGQSFTYAKAVPSGHYALWLEFAEPTATSTGQRIFDVSAEGATVLDNFDIVAAAGANHTAVAKTFDVTVNDGQLNLAFAGVTGEAIVSAIVVIPTDATDAAAPYSWASMSDTARIVTSQSHLRILGQEMVIYANENKGKYPSNWVVLKDYTDARLEDFANPRTSTSLPRGELTDLEESAWVASRNDYVYLGAGKKTSTPPDTVLAYENPGRESGDINILWGDLHVSSLSRSEAAAKIGFADAPPTNVPAWPGPMPTSAPILQSQANLRTLSNGLSVYANDHRGVFPVDLGTLYLGGYVSDISAFIDPRSGTQAPPADWTRDQKAAWINQNTRYRFHGASVKVSEAAEQVVVSEDPSLTDGGINILTLDGSVRFIETRWADEMLVHRAPIIKNSSFTWNTGPQRISVLFQAAIASQSLGGDGIRIENLDTGNVIPSSSVAAAFGSASQLSINFTFPGYGGGSLPNGNYRAALADHLTGVGGAKARGDWSLDFYVLAGDANRDRVVNIDDFNLLAASFGKTNQNFSSGNFDYSADTTVTITDFNLLAANFGRHVDAPVANPPAPLAAIFTTTTSASPATITPAKSLDLLEDVQLVPASEAL